MPGLHVPLDDGGISDDDDDTHDDDNDNMLGFHVTILSIDPF